MTRRTSTRAASFALLSLALLALPAVAQAPRSGTLHRPAGASGPVVVPDTLLRSWDPITVFFAQPKGPSVRGPEDHPERYVQLAPHHPIAARWLDASTLQLRPVEAWTPLGRYRLTVDTTAFELATLSAPPIATDPADGTTGVEAIDGIRLTFAEPLDPAVLAEMIRIELRPLPGLDPDSSRWLEADDLTIKPLERTDQGEPATYVVTPETPIGGGKRVTLHLQLAADNSLEEAASTIVFATLEPFRLVAAGTWSMRLPLPPEGIQFPDDQPVQGPADRRAVVLELSDAPADGALDPVVLRNMVRVTPAVAELAAQTRGELVELTGPFEPETAYRVTLVPQPIRDRHGRTLTDSGPSSLSVYFPRQSPYARWSAAHGVVERFGPQLVPVDGRGHERIDLRIHKIDPLDRSFWPFPDEPVDVDESSRPPGPGETPAPFTDASRPISRWQLERQLRTLGSPLVSTIQSLPLRQSGRGARFGLDLADHLADAVGRDRPGHYLIGLRRLDAGTTRSWMRVQVTDLCLTVVEEPRQVRFLVTSLSSASPVAGARVRIEGSERRRDGGSTGWRTFGDVVTSADGHAVWRAPGEDTRYQRTVRRIVVEHGEDILILDSSVPSEQFADGAWTTSYDSWLQWTVERHGWRTPEVRQLGHIFTERPVYRPGDPVHIGGWLRQREAGRLERLVVQQPQVIVNGPGGLEWRADVELSNLGGFAFTFDEETPATGEYAATIADRDGHVFARATFQVEAYRLPRFEVALLGPDTVALDQPFAIELAANYYAGGNVSLQPVRWRVTQFPYEWSPPTDTGFQFSSDARFSGRQRFESTPQLEQTDVTDEAGGAILELDPTLEPTAQPRSYVVEATVTGPDDQTVSSTRQIVALPPFVIGIRAPRVVERAAVVEPELVVLGIDGEPLAGQELNVRLLHRQWHSHLRASDFTDGIARYITDQVDVPVFETTVTSSGEEPVRPALPLEQAGVYVVEVTGRDRLGRAQTVQVDLYASGDEPVAWSRPSTRVFSVATDRSSYEPGSSATLVLSSPFQRAQALVIVEGPERNEYRWVDVRGGAATVDVPISPTFAPRVPVHTVLMRGRVPGTGPQPHSPQDLGKPQTVASTTWLAVEPTANRVEVTLDHPITAQPGSTFDLTIRLATPDNRPLAGEITVWLVDQAVLALGREQRLDPLPDFLPPARSRLQLRDTRDLPFGQVPFSVPPGGGEGAMAEEELLDRVTVRRDFQPVPFYRANVPVGADGELILPVTLPDNLTNFKIRVKAASGVDRFGFATGHLAVRLPVIVQPALPRFVRPGDRFSAAAVARVVSGPDGRAIAQWRLEGAIASSPTETELTLARTTPARVALNVEVPSASASHLIAPDAATVTFRAAVERSSDGASDGFEVALPIRDDRRESLHSERFRLAPGETLELAGANEAVRPKTSRRTITLTGLDELERLDSGLDFLLRYPYGCTEQRVAVARTHLGLRRLRDVLQRDGFDERLDAVVRDTLAWIPDAVDDHGLVAFWPGARGSVTLTAWVTQFLVEARASGYAVDGELIDALLDRLQRSLRSDDQRLISGAAWAERTWALAAVTAAGRPDPAYASELSRRSQLLDLEGLALVLQAVVGTPEAQPAVDTLRQQLLDGIKVRLHQGAEHYDGLNDRGVESSRLLASELRTMAEMVRALSRAGGSDPRTQLLMETLVRTAGGDGWRSTNTAAAALLAIAERIEPPLASAPQLSATAQRAERTVATLTAGPQRPLASTTIDDVEALRLTLDESSTAAANVRVDSRWIPSEPGSLASAESHGFVVTRTAAVVGEPASERRWTLDEPGASVALSVGEVVEEQIEVINPGEHHFVAIVAPLAAGLEPLNPHLATASNEATPSLQPTITPTYVVYADDQVAFFYDTLPKGTVRFAYRCRATVAGRFVQPPAMAEAMYDPADRGRSAGAWVEVTPQP